MSAGPCLAALLRRPVDARPGRPASRGAPVLRAALLALLVASCAVPPAAGPQPVPARPELAPLAALVGVWEGAGTSTFADGTELAFTTRTELRPELGGQVLLERTLLRVEGHPPGRSLAFWSWDAAAGLYRTWRRNDAGLREEGLATWDPEQRVWRIESRTLDTTSGDRLLGSGEMRFVTPDEKVHTWVARDAATDAELYRVEGRSERVAP